MDTTIEPRGNSFQRFPPSKPHSHSHSTQTLLDSCQLHLETFFSTFEKLRVDLLSVLEEYEKLLRATSLENGVKSFKDTVTWIFEPVEEKTLSLSTLFKAAFSELSDILSQRNRGVTSYSNLNNGTDPPHNGTQAIRSYKKLSKQEINGHKVRLLQPCVEQLIELLVVFFQKGQELYPLREQGVPPQSSALTPPEQDLNQVPAFFPSLPQMLQVPTAHWFVASQTSAEIRQEDLRLHLTATTRSDVYIRKQLREYVQHLDKTPFKRFQVLGGFQCNPNDVCRALERCTTEEELAQLNEYYIRRGEEIREGVVMCEVPQDTTYVIGDVEVLGDGTNKINHEIERLCDRVCLEGGGTGRKKRLAESITFEVCSDLLKKSSYVSVLLLYGKAYLVEIAESTRDFPNKIVISQMDDKLGLKVEEVRRWKIVPSSGLEDWNVQSYEPLATIETCFKKDFEFSSTDDTFIIETVDVRIRSINHGLDILKQNTTASEQLLSVSHKHTATHRTYSLPVESVDFRSNGERDKLQAGHPALQQTISLHFLEDSNKYSRANLANSHSKTGSSESISSVSTLRAINPDFGLSSYGGDDVRQQLFQNTTFQHMQTSDRLRKWEQPQKSDLSSWPRDDVSDEPGADSSRDFFMDLFYKTNQDLNSPKQQEEKRGLPSPSKDRSPRIHKRNFSVDNSQSSPAHTAPEKHQSVTNLSYNPASSNDNLQTAGDIGQHWSSSLSNDNLTKCQSWPTVCGLDLDFPAHPPKDTTFGPSSQIKNRSSTKLEDSIDSSLYDSYSSPEETRGKEYHCSDSELWPSKRIWGGEGLGSSLNLSRPPALSSDSESCPSDSDNKDSYRAKELTRTRYKPLPVDNKPKSNHQFSRPPPPPFSPANSPQPRPIYHQPSPPPPPPPHWERVDPNVMPPHAQHPPPPPPGWNGNHWHEGAPPMPMPPMHGPHPGGQWGPPPPPHGANMPPHHHPHTPHQGPPPHGQQFSYPPPPPHFPPPIGLHSTPTPPESPRPPQPPPHQVIHPNGQVPPLQHPIQIPSSTAPRPNSPVPPNQPYPPPYGPPMHRMDPNHLHNQGPPRGPPPYYVHRMPRPHYYHPIPNTSW